MCNRTPLDETAKRPKPLVVTEKTGPQNARNHDYATNNAR